MLRFELLQQIRRAHARGLTHFIVGMADGVDIMAAELVLKLRSELSLTLECAVPFRAQAAMYSYQDKKRYRSILESADIRTLIAEEYSSRCYELRNEYMVDRSALVIAVFDGQSGGTRNTVEYAKSNNVETVILSPNRV